MGKLPTHGPNHPPRPTPISLTKSRFQPLNEIAGIKWRCRLSLLRLNGKRMIHLKMPLQLSLLSPADRCGKRILSWYKRRQFQKKPAFGGKEAIFFHYVCAAAAVAQTVSFPIHRKNVMRFPHQLLGMTRLTQLPRRIRLEGKGRLPAVRIPYPSTSVTAAYVTSPRLPFSWGRT